MGVLAMNDFEYALSGYRLTTVEIVYRLPDYPDVLQKKGGNLFFFVTIMDEVKKLREWIILI